MELIEKQQRKSSVTMARFPQKTPSLLDKSAKQLKTQQCFIPVASKPQSSAKWTTERMESSQRTLPEREIVL